MWCTTAVTSRLYYCQTSLFPSLYFLSLSPVHMARPPSPFSLEPIMGRDHGPIGVLGEADDGYRGGRTVQNASGMLVRWNLWSSTLSCRDVTISLPLSFVVPFALSFVIVVVLCCSHYRHQWIFIALLSSLSPSSLSSFYRLCCHLITLSLILSVL